MSTKEYRPVFIRDGLQGEHSRLGRTTLTTAIACGLTLGLAGQAWSAPVGVSISKVVDTEMAVPVVDPPQYFRNFSYAAISGDEVALVGSYGDYKSSVFTALDGTFRYLDTGTPDSLQTPDEPSVSQGTVAFLMSYSHHSHSEYSIEVASHGVVTTVVSGSHFHVGSLGSNPTVSKGMLAFSLFFDDGAGITGVYRYDSKASGALPVPVVTTSDPIPSGTGNFVRFGDVSIDKNLVAFQGYDNEEFPSGIYMKDLRSAKKPVRAVVDTATPIPHGTRNFQDFGKLSLYGDKVAFHGTETYDPDSTTLDGIYTAQKNALDVVADTSTPLPNGAGSFTGFGDPSLDDGLLAFFASDSNGGGGIYLDREEVNPNPLLNVIGTRDVLDGKAITGLTFIRGGLSGNKLVFVANFPDGSAGVYKAEIATTKAQCQKGGYTKFNFKNQGQCIKFVNTGK